MRIALAQINSLLGDFSANATKIIEYATRAKDRRCDLVVYPEAALFGYHPVDLLERPGIVTEQESYLKKIQQSLPKDIGIVVGAIVKNSSGKGKSYWNAAVFLQKGKKPQIFPKELLPTYDVFDESRHIQPGDLKKNILRFKGKKFLITICEDIWGWPRKNNPGFANYGQNPLLNVPRRGIDMVINLSASPFTETKFEKRQIVTRATVARFKCPMIYVNMVGGQDELIFDGGSFALNSRGKVTAQCIRFGEDLNVFEMPEARGDWQTLSENPNEILHSALVLGLRDFVQKTGFKKVHLGLSGGVDSALVACLAADAVGPMNVTTIYLPGPFSSKLSRDLSARLAKNLGVEYYECSVSDLYEASWAQFSKVFGKSEFDVTNENIQARLRAVLLMAFANREGSLLLGTTNKSELAVGYGTLYGDMTGGIMPIADLLKGQVYQLAEYYNSEAELIPKDILTRAPSAELKPNQTDQDTLPPYDKLDAAITRLVEGFHSPANELEQKILQLMIKSEFKRWQAPPVLKVSNHSFGRGRRFPVAHRAGL